MASSTLRDASSVPVPQEILQLICKDLDRSDLKNVRLACKKLNDAAEIPLFRYLCLRRNMESFRRLRMIASTPHLAKLTKGIIYSEELVTESDEGLDFETWRRKYSGRAIDCFWDLESDTLSKSCTTADLHRCYSRWCAQLHSQRLMQKFDIEEKDLEDAFGKLPQLEEIYFGSGKERSIILDSVMLEYFSAFGVATFEPYNPIGARYHVGQFTSMMAAAYKNNKKLKVIEARSLRWKVFQQHHEVLAMMNANMRYCERFKWRPTTSDENVNGDLHLGLMMRNAPRLRSIELNFKTGLAQYPGYLNSLSRILDQHCHWPDLEHVRLYGFKVSDTHLRGFLAAHASSMRSLDLGLIILTPYELKGELHYSSWIRFIIFLQESLNLRKMRFRDVLANERKENWSVGDRMAELRRGKRPGQDQLTVKDRVERYVVEGGDFPLPWPTEAEDESRWRDVLLDFRSRLDESWRHYEYLYPVEG